MSTVVKKPSQKRTDVFTRGIETENGYPLLKPCPMIEIQYTDSDDTDLDIGNVLMTPNNKVYEEEDGMFLGVLRQKPDGEFYLDDSVKVDDEVYPTHKKLLFFEGGYPTYLFYTKIYTKKYARNKKQFSYDDPEKGVVSAVKESDRVYVGTIRW